MLDHDNMRKDLIKEEIKEITDEFFELLDTVGTPYTDAFLGSLEDKGSDAPNSNIFLLEVTCGTDGDRFNEVLDIIMGQYAR
ncbi:hypothetical protein BVRB_031920, partial [Beta vulgaris subsp. vulgaris]